MYLAIRNKGVADQAGFTLIGASGSRGNENAIGCFGSGGKLSIALMLRMGIRPIIYRGLHRMEFFSKPVFANGKTVNQVCVTHSGTKHSTEELGFVLEWGVADWDKPEMALREFYANAIDGAVLSGGSSSDVEHEVVVKPRGFRDYTQIYLPYTPVVEQMYATLPTMFLHVNKPDYLNKVCLPKSADENHVLIYKQGVLVATLPGKSVFDYNLSDLRLDESRNASTWDVESAVARAVAKEDSGVLTSILRGVRENPEVFEGRLHSGYLASRYETDETVRKERGIKWMAAWKAVAGEKGIATDKGAHFADFVIRKGYTPVSMPSSAMYQALEAYGVPSLVTILDKNEQSGRTTVDATPEMHAAVKWAFDLVSAFGMANGKQIPPVKGFQQIMDAGAQTWGEYLDGTIYLHVELGGNLLKKVALEELVHHLTGSFDGSRDLQDFLLRLVTEMAS